MSTWVWILTDLAFLGAFFWLFACMFVVSSRCSRRDEAYYVLHPPNQSGEAGQKADDSTVTRNRLNDDTNVNRCVCCGEIIPEGLQVCANCEQRIKKPDAWW